jgi:prolipoprotein diacylglyceryltransferase
MGDTPTAAMPLASHPVMVSAPAVFATYVHDLDPVIFQVGKWPLRWYGMAYLLAFVAGFLLLRSLARRKLWVLEPDGWATSSFTIFPRSVGKD